MARTPGQTPQDPRDGLKARNRRTALILLSIALVFFGSVIINRILAG